MMLFTFDPLSLAPHMYTAGSSGGRPIFRTGSLKSSHELISPSSSAGAISVHSVTHNARKFPFDELDEDGSHSDDDEEDDGSWI